jgi:hypothetical protein
MQLPFMIDRIQVVSILFSLFILLFIFGLVKNRRVREEYSILWFAMGFFLLYLSLDRYAIDRFGTLLGIAYPPSVLTLMTTGFTFLLLIHLTMVLTRLSEQNKELIQELGLGRLAPGERCGEVLVIIPAYNEAANLAAVIADLGRLTVPLDILVVNDGSLDETSRVARAASQAIVVDLAKNLGIGGAVQTGFKYAARQGYRVALQFDGDGQHLAGEIPKLLARLEQGDVNMVIGSRFLQGQDGYRSTFVRRLGIRLFETVNSLLTRQRITDNTSGFRAYDSRAIEFLARHYPLDYPEPEVVILLGRNGFAIAEVQARMAERQQGRSSINGLRGGYYMVKVLLAILMTALRKPLVKDVSRP